MVAQAVGADPTIDNRPGRPPVRCGSWR